MLAPYFTGPHRDEGILGRTFVTDAAVRKRLNDALRTSARESNGRMMSCFSPRHAIRVTDGGGVTDVLICFECLQAQVWRDEKLVASFTITKSAQPVFDEVLKRAGVALADPNEYPATRPASSQSAAH